MSLAHVDDAHSLQRLLHELALDQAAHHASAFPAPATRAFLKQTVLAVRLATHGAIIMPAPADGSRPHFLRNLDAPKSSG
jgi:hypothetical protein